MRRLRGLVGRRSKPAAPESQDVRATRIEGRPVTGGLPSLHLSPDLPGDVAEILRQTSLGVASSSDRPGIVVATDSRVAGSALWLWIDPDTAVDAAAVDGAELVLVPDERTRELVELSTPQAIGKTWVLHGPSIERVVARYYPERAVPSSLGIIGYNLKFIRPIVAGLLRSAGTTALIDEWRTFAANPTTATDEVLDECEVVVCEWCGKNAAYASRNRRPGQRVIVRLHRWELSTDYWREIDIDNIDLVITVGGHYRALLLETTGWPEDKVSVIPNHVDDLQLDRPKHQEAPFTIGMLGASSSRKRMDLALDLISALHAADPRFRLRIKTELPADVKWVWDNAEERVFFEQQQARLTEPPLNEIVSFDPFGPDVAAWFRRIGFIVSLSDDESFHLSPAEGMTSGAVPVIRGWPGADSIYAPEWIANEIPAMVERILSLTADHNLLQRTVEAGRSQSSARFGLDSVVDSWANLLQS